MKRTVFQSVFFVITAIILIVITLNVIGFFRDTSHVTSGWGTFIPALGLSYFASIVFVICADFLWLLWFVLWLITKVFYIKSEDHSLTMP